MLKKCLLIFLLGLFPFELSAQSADLASAIVDDTVTGENRAKQEYELKKEEKEVTDDRGIFSFFNFSFIKKPLSVFSFKNEEKNDFNDSGETKTEEKKETPLERAARVAEEGNVDVALSLGYMYLYGQDGVEVDYPKAFHFYELAAEKNNIIALNNLGSLYFNGIGTAPDYNKAAALFLRAAQNGSDDAAVNLAFIYLSSSKKQYFEPAIDLFEQAAKVGNNTAKFMLGYAYYKGFVVEKDFHKAVELIREAANANFDEAQYVFGNIYENGDGITKNYNSAVKYYRAAIAQGNVEAMVQLAGILKEGRMYPRNLIQAHALYNVASVYGAPDASEKRDDLESALKLEELLDAQTMAEGYKEAPSELTSYIRQTFGKNIRFYIDKNLNKQRKN